MAPESAPPRVAVVTGASSGIGLETAKALAAQGCRVVAAGRSPERLRSALEAIERVGGPAPRGALADLSLRGEVLRLSSEILSREPRVDILVNNAGAIFAHRGETAEGTERTFALNVLAPFLLTRELLPALRSSPGGRVVNVASMAHRSARLQLDDLESRHHYLSWRVYGRSKLALILLTREFARREPPGTVTFNCCHPGFVRSHFAQDNPGVVGPAFRFFAALGGISPQRGAQTSVFLATSPEVAGRTGGYFVRCREVAPSLRAQDPATAGELWEALGREAENPGAPGR